jgi:hypothetical protein
MVAIVLCLAVGQAEQPTPPTVDKRRVIAFVERSIEHRRRTKEVIQNAIEEKTAELADLNNARINRLYKGHRVDKKGQHWFHDEDQKRLAVQTLGKWISDRENVLVLGDAFAPIIPAPIETPITASAIGVFSEPVRIKQVLDDLHVLVRAGTEEICVAGLSTAGLTSGEQLRLTEVYAVAGTRSYQNQAGYTQTVAELYPINPEQLAKFLPPLPKDAAAANDRK